jgi:hypothetical protein
MPRFLSLSKLQITKKGEFRKLALCIIYMITDGATLLL